jgi:hypothetical protein
MSRASIRTRRPSQRTIDVAQAADGRSERSSSPESRAGSDDSADDDGLLFDDYIRKHKLSIPPLANCCDADEVCMNIVALLPKFSVDHLSCDTIRFAMSTSVDDTELAADCKRALRSFQCFEPGQTGKALFAINDGMLDGVDTHWGMVILAPSLRKMLLINTDKQAAKTSQRLVKTANKVRHFLNDIFPAPVGHTGLFDTVGVLHCCQQPGGTECCYQSGVAARTVLNSEVFFLRAFQASALIAAQITKQVNDEYCGIRLYTETMAAADAVVNLTSPTVSAKAKKATAGITPIAANKSATSLTSATSALDEGATVKQHTILRPTTPLGWNDKKTVDRSQLIIACTERGLKGMSRKSREELAKILEASSSAPGPALAAVAPHWDVHCTARLIHLLCAVNLNLTPQIQQRYAADAPDPNKGFRESNLLEFFCNKDTAKTREELDAKSGPKEVYWDLMHRLFNDGLVNPLHLQDMKDVKSQCRLLDPNAAKLPQALRKLQDKYGELRKKWDVVYGIKFKASGHNNPDFWAFCHGDTSLYYLYLAMTERNSEQLWAQFPSKVPSGVSYDASVCPFVYLILFIFLLFINYFLLLFILFYFLTFLN